MYDIISRKTFIFKGHNNLKISICLCGDLYDYQSIVSETKLSDQFIIQVRRSYENILYNLSLKDANKLLNKEISIDRISEDMLQKIKIIKQELEKIEVKDSPKGCLIVDQNSMEKIDGFDTVFNNYDGYVIFFGGLEMKYEKVKRKDFDFLDCIAKENKRSSPTCIYCRNNRQYEKSYKFKNLEYTICEKCLTDIRSICARINGNKKVKKDIVSERLTS